MEKNPGKRKAQKKKIKRYGEETPKQRKGKDKKRGKPTPFFVLVKKNKKERDSKVSGEEQILESHRKKKEFSKNTHSANPKRRKGRRSRPSDFHSVGVFRDMFAKEERMGKSGNVQNFPATKNHKPKEAAEIRLGEWKGNC